MQIAMFLMKQTICCSSIIFAMFNPSQFALKTEVVLCRIIIDAVASGATILVGLSLFIFDVTACNKIAQNYKL